MQFQRIFFPKSNMYHVHCKYFDGDFIDWKIIPSSLVPFMQNNCVYCNLKQLSPTVMFFAQKHFKRKLTFIIMFPMNFLSKEQQLKVKFRVNLSIKLIDSLILIEKQPHTCKTIVYCKCILNLKPRIKLCTTFSDYNQMFLVINCLSNCKTFFTQNNSREN